MYQWGQGFGARYESLSGGSSIGTAIDSSASANTKGSWVSLGTPAFTYEHLIVCTNDIPNAAGDFVFDIGLGTTGNQWVLAENLRTHARKATLEGSHYYGLPLHVPSGVEVWARSQCTNGNQNFRLSVKGYSSGLRGRPGFSRLIALYTPTSSRGITVDPGAAANTKVRTQIIASSAQRVVAVMAGIGPNADVARTTTANALFDIETGGSGSERVLGTVAMSWGTAMDSPTNVPTSIFPCDVPAASRFSVNAQCSDTGGGDRTFDLALWGFVT